MPLTLEMTTSSPSLCELSRIDGCHHGCSTEDDPAPLQGASPIWSGTTEGVRMACGTFERGPHQMRICVQTIPGQGRDFSYALDFIRPLPADVQVVLLGTRTVLQISVDPCKEGPVVTQSILGDPENFWDTTCFRLQCQPRNTGQHCDGHTLHSVSVHLGRDCEDGSREELQVLPLQDSVPGVAYLSLQLHTRRVSPQQALVAVALHGVHP